MRISPNVENKLGFLEQGPLTCSQLSNVPVGSLLYITSRINEDIEPRIETFVSFNPNAQGIWIKDPEPYLLYLNSWNFYLIPEEYT